MERNDQPENDLRVSRKGWLGNDTTKRLCRVSSPCGATMNYEPPDPVVTGEVCDFFLYPHYPNTGKSEPAQFCGQPAAWKWTHASIKCRPAAVPDMFDKIVTDYYCEDHGQRMQDKGGFGDVGTWERIGPNVSAQGRRVASRTLRRIVRLIRSAFRFVSRLSFPG